MNQRDKVIGFELLCRAIDCVNNDKPVCKVHSVRSPVIIGFQGRCIRYIEKEGFLRAPDEEK